MINQLHQLTDQIPFPHSETYNQRGQHLIDQYELADAFDPEQLPAIQSKFQKLLDNIRRQLNIPADVAILPGESTQDHYWRCSAMSGYSPPEKASEAAHTAFSAYNLRYVPKGKYVKPVIGG